MIAVNQNHATAERWVNFAPTSATVGVGKIHCVRIAPLAPRQPHQYHETTKKNGILPNMLNVT
jgi:hypothetical protein